tara:strand:- start:78 stop:488 length:411 start_codon:yes stop_codon:yes gene_type:complete
MEWTKYKYGVWIIVVLATFSNLYANTALLEDTLYFTSETTSTSSIAVYPKQTEASNLPKDSLDLHKGVLELIESEEEDHRQEKDASPLTIYSTVLLFSSLISEILELKNTPLKLPNHWSFSYPTCKKHLQFEVFLI